MRRQSSETNSSVEETGYIPESHSYRESYDPPSLNDSVPEDHGYAEYGGTVESSSEVSRKDRRMRSVVDDEPAEAYAHDDVGGSRFRTDYDSGVYASSSAASATVTTSVSAVSHIVVAAAAVVIMVVGVIMPAIGDVPSGVVYEDIITTDSSIYYRIFFEDYEEGMDLTVTLHNNFTERSHAVKSERFSVTEWNLKPGMEYTITVTGPMSVTVSERVVRTNGSSDAPYFVMNCIEYDDFGSAIRYSPTSSDPSGVWSEYRASMYIVEPIGGRTILATEPLENINEEHALAFMVPDQSRHDAVFTIECTEAGETRLLYSKDFSVIGIPYYSLASASLDSSSDSFIIRSEIFDPMGLRSDYTATITVTNASDPSQSYSLSKGITAGEDTVFDNVSRGYTFFDIHLKVECVQFGTVATLAETDCSSYTGPSVGNIHATFRPDTNDLFVTFDLVDRQGAFGTLSLEIVPPVPGVMCSQDLSPSDRSAIVELIDYPNMRGTIATVYIRDGETTLASADGISLYGNDSTFTLSDTEVINPSNGVRGINVVSTIYDPDGIWSDFTATVTRGELTLYNGSIAMTGYDTLQFTVPFSNGTADLTISCTERHPDGTTSDRQLYAGEVEVYSGPSITVSPTGYVNANNVGTVSIEIDDRFDQWGNMTAEISGPATEVEPISCMEDIFDKTATSLSFNLSNEPGIPGYEYTFVLYSDYGTHREELFILPDHITFQLV